MKISPDVNNWAPILVSQDNAPLYNGFWFIMQPNWLAIGYGDGMGEFVPAFRRGKEASFPNISNRWAHVATVVRGAQDMSLYVDGVDVGGGYSGDSPHPMSSNWPADVARIGKWTSNGQTVRFKGEMDEVRFWNRALSIGEIRESMCKKITGNGLKGLWSFNELGGATCIDDSPGGHNGAFVSTPERIFSGAPLGEASTYSYVNQVTTKLPFFTDTLIVTEPMNMHGLHIYGNNTLPSQVGGISFACTTKPYFGVFVARIVNNIPSYNITSQPSDFVGYYIRDDNSMPVWVNAVAETHSGKVMYRNVAKSLEVMTTGVVVEPELGADTAVCLGSEVVLRTDVSIPGLQYLWSNGSTSDTLATSTPGIYWLQLTTGCGVARDSVLVIVREKPSVDFGEDLKCMTTSLELRASVVTDATSLQWSDGSSAMSLMANSPGKYWLTAMNECGVSADTVWLRQVPQAIDFPEPNICSHTPVLLEPDLPEDSYDLMWNEGSSSATLLVEKSGRYTVTISNQCGADSTSVDVRVEPEGIILPNVITPNDDNLNETFNIAGGIEDVRLIVFDRWGLEVYRDNDYKNTWGAEGLSAGVYFYRVTFGCKERTAKGHVTIVK